MQPQAAVFGTRVTVRQLLLDESDFIAQNCPVGAVSCRADFTAVSESKLTDRRGRLLDRRPAAWWTQASSATPGRDRSFIWAD